MILKILDPHLTTKLIREREASGFDRYDEVWEGTYMVAPTPGTTHQFITNKLTRFLDTFVGDRGAGVVLAGVNISDRQDDWKMNYRIPDLCVFLNSNRAVDHGSFWLGGPDLAIEVLSKNDQARSKFDFYADVGVLEVLLVDSMPYELQLHRCENGQFRKTQTASAGSGAIVSTVAQTRFEITSSAGGPPSLTVRNLIDDCEHTFILSIN